MIPGAAISHGLPVAAAIVALGGNMALHAGAAGEDGGVLDPARFAHHVERFNTMEDENRANFVPNSQAWEWLRGNTPFFECPDKEVEEIYYYRWWALRKHLRRTDTGFVFTEFITKDRPVSSALGHQLMEIRWLRDQRYADDYVRHWLRGNHGQPQDHLHKYSGWLEYALWQRWLVTQDTPGLVAWLDDLMADYRRWEQEKRTPEGLFWQNDVWDAMEESISGGRKIRNLRPPLNSYMYGNARAIAAIGRLAGRPAVAAEFDAKAAELRRLVQARLWNADAKFFEVRRETGALAEVREEIGFIPWYFHLPDPGKGFEAAWAQLVDDRGFRAPYGITTAERRHPGFRSHGVGTCEWDGAVWPFATSQTLVALANVLRDYPAQPFVSVRDYFEAFRTYVHSQHYDGKPYIGEYLDETTGQWLMGRQERSRYYNHSTFADLLITGVVGLRPRADDVVEVQPLLPPDTWDWFCLDCVSYHGRTLTVLWDCDGRHYGRGVGFTVLVDGATVAHADKLVPVRSRLP